MLQVERGRLNGHGSLAFSLTLRPREEGVGEGPVAEGEGEGGCEELVLVAPMKTRCVWPVCVCVYADVAAL